MDSPDREFPGDDDVVRDTNTLVICEKILEKTREAVNHLKKWESSWSVRHLRCRDAQGRGSRRPPVVTHSVVFHLEHGDHPD